jgi:hypothetical protein
MQHFARSLISPLAVSLCVLCAFAVRLRNPDSNQHRAKRGFLAKAQSSQGTVPNEERFVVLLVWLRRSE